MFTLRQWRGHYAKFKPGLRRRGFSDVVLQIVQQAWHDPKCVVDGGWVHGGPTDVLPWDATINSEGGGLPEDVVLTLPQIVQILLL